MKSILDYTQAEHQQAIEREYHRLSSQFLQMKSDKNETTGFSFLLIQLAGVNHQLKAQEALFDSFLDKIKEFIRHE